MRLCVASFLLQAVLSRVGKTRQWEDATPGTDTFAVCIVLELLTGHVTVMARCVHTQSLVGDLALSLLVCGKFIGHIFSKKA